MTFKCPSRLPNVTPIESYPISDILHRFGDIRDQTGKWHKIDRNFSCFGHKFFWSESPRISGLAL